MSILEIYARLSYSPRETTDLADPAMQGVHGLTGGVGAKIVA